MKAVVNERHGSPDILEIREILPPKPQTGEILVKTTAS
jgi:NADPH:quinone reductase-like Zn-dependent oxidoreductase